MKILSSKHPFLATFLLFSLTLYTQLHAGDQWANIFEQSKDKVVQIFAYGSAYNLQLPFKKEEIKGARGSGFLVSAEGDIYTNYHVIDSAADVIYIQHPLAWKEHIEVEFLGAHADIDVAHLRIKPEGLQRLIALNHGRALDYFSIDQGNSDTLRQGEKIMLIGYPLGEENIKHAIGNISGQEQTRWGECLTSTAISCGGNSGGPCINKTGDLVGIVIGHNTETSALNYLIPISRVKIALDALTSKTVHENAFWGIATASTTPTTLRYLGNPGDAGAYVTKVDYDSLCNKAGIKKGDVIAYINGLKVDRFGFVAVPWTHYRISLDDMLARIKMGENATFGVYRDGNLMECSVIKTLESPFKIKRYHHPFQQEPAYDVFGGLVIMELTKNHLDAVTHDVANLLKQGIYIDSTRYLDKDNHYASKIIITHRFPETELFQNRVFDIYADPVINTVNGKKVATIKDFQHAVRDGAETGFIVIETEGGAIAALNIENILEQEPMLIAKYRYEPSPLCKFFLENCEEHNN